MSHLKTIDIQGCPLSYYELNETAPGPAILYVHGNSMAAESFRSVWASPALAGQRQVALNLPGHGDSAWLPAYSLEVFAGVLVAFVRAVGLEHPHLVGCSLGGHICVQAMERLRPTSVFLFGNPPAGKPLATAAFLPCAATPLLFGPGPENDEDLAPLWEALRYNDAQAAQALAWYRGTDPSFRTMMLESVGRGEYQDETVILAHPVAPTTFLLCEEDPIVSTPFIWRTLADLHPGIATVSLETGHLPQLEAPAQFAHILSKHIQRSIAATTSQARTYGKHADSPR